MRKLVVLKQSADVHTPGLNQALADAYLRSGRMEKHIADICASYKTQLDAMLSMMDCLPEGTQVTRPQGGLFVWAALPERFDAQEMLQAAVHKNVAYVPGTFFYSEKGTHKNSVRLNFSMADVESIRRGMALLGEVFR
jgi:2-aminoadipate transaminase